jgi:hypothetical protein
VLVHKPGKEMVLPILSLAPHTSKSWTLKTIGISWPLTPLASSHLLPLPFSNLQNLDRRFKIAPIVKLKLLKPLKYSVRKALADWLTTFLGGKNLTDFCTIKENYIFPTTKSSVLKLSKSATICLWPGIPANMEHLSLSHVITSSPR